LVAADRVFPDAIGDVFPVGDVVEVDVVGLRAEEGDRIAEYVAFMVGVVAVNDSVICENLSQKYG
jgi:hypothetical protein